MRYIVVDGTGTILRSGFSPNPSLQADTGQTVYALEGADGALISDANVTVSGGVITPAPGYEGPIPEGDLILVADA